MTQTATSKRGQGVSIVYYNSAEDENKRVASLAIDETIVGRFATGMEAREKAAELTSDVGLIWETRP